MAANEELLAEVVKNPDLQLNPGETCYFQAKAQIGTPHEEIVTTTKAKPGLGVGFRVTKHLGIGVGRQKITTKTETHTVWDKEPCTFFITNERFILKTKKQNILLDPSRITNFKVNKDAVTITVGSQDCYLFMATKDVKHFIKVFELMAAVGKEQLAGKNLPSNSNAQSSQGDDTQRNTIPPNYAQTIFLWYTGRKPTAVLKRDQYPSYLFYDCKIQNASKYHKEMIQDGYLEPAPIADCLTTLKLPELKEILQNNGLNTTGKKADLITRIIDNVPEKTLSALFPEKKYILSDKGKAFIEENNDYIKLREHPNWQISAAEYDAAKGSNNRFYDVCWGIFNRRIAQGDLFSHRNTYYNMYTLLKEEGKTQSALEMLLRVLYYDVNSLSCGYTYSFLQKNMTKKEFVDRAAESLYFAPAVIKDIGDLEEYFSDEMVNRLYSHKEAIQPCSEKLFSEIVHAILDGSFDEGYYKERLIMDYRKV